MNISLSAHQAELEQAASEAGLSVSEYVRQAAAMRPSRRLLVKPQITISISTLYSQYGTLVVWNESEAVIPEIAQMTSQGLALIPVLHA